MKKKHSAKGAFLISVTMTGNSEPTIREALASVVDWVDAVLVVDTGATDRTLQIAREVAGEKLIKRRFTWCDDFAAARNFALQAAHDAGAQWAVMIDSDETIDRRGDDVRGTLAAASGQLIMLRHESGTYGQPRFFRLPVVGRFEGPTHEAYVGFTSQSFERAVFRDKPKTPEQEKAKFERDARILLAHVAQHPKAPRWHYYLGDTFEMLGQTRKAIDSFVRCAELRGWDEESAWACYRAAACWCTLKEYTRAIDCCAAGLARHPGIAELAWLASFAAYSDNRMDTAIAWARMSIATGSAHGIGRSVKRFGFCNPEARFEKPYDVLRYAYRQVGDAKSEQEVARLYDEARAMRLASQNGTAASSAAE